MILEMAFPHCIVRSFHYARASLPTSGAAVTEPRDGLCTREEASRPPGGPLRASPRGLARGGHTPCVRAVSTARRPGEGPLRGSSCFCETELRVLPCGRSRWPGVRW